jgi:hypothetical protein
MLTFLLVSVACLFYSFYPVQLFSLHKEFSSALQALLENVEMPRKTVYVPGNKDGFK